jgi:hypothetical protein
MTQAFLRILILCGLIHFAAVGVCAGQSTNTIDQQCSVRTAALRGLRATYSCAPRLENGRVDLRLLVAQLVDIHANTYSFAIHGVTNDWEDLQLFLPLAREQGIRVWGSVVPPSESPPRSHAYAEPFRLDYVRWAVEFAKLSLRETNLVAWSIDDFSANLTTTYTPEYLGKMMAAAHAINPMLAFVPCCYYKSFSADFATHYQPLLDGILFPYRHESGGANLTDASLVESEVKKIKGLTAPGFPIILDVYATAHSRLGKSTPEYVRQVMVSGKNCADGVMVYCHQDPKLFPEKYQIIKELFGAWSSKN